MKNFYAVKYLLALLMLSLVGVKGWGQNVNATWNAGGSAWYTGSNWVGNSYPGLQGAASSNTNTATFTSSATGTTFGINMNTASLNLGAISLDNTRTTATNVGNSSSAAAGVLRFYGATVNSIANTILRNNGSGTFTLQVTQSGGGTMGVVLANSTNNIVNLDGSGSIVISSIISSLSGSTPFTVAGAGTAGTVSLTGTGTTANTFTGTITLNGPETVFSADGSYGNTSNGILIDGGRMTTAAPGFTIGSTRSIQVSSAAGTSISTKGTNTTTYNGVIADKTSTTGGSWAKQGGGTLQLGGVSTYTGSTSINNGTIQLTTGSNRLPTGTLVNIGQAASTNLGTFDLNGFNQQIGGLSTTAGTATSGNNTVTSASAATLTISGSGSNTFGSTSAANPGTISGAVSIVKSGTGTQTFGGGAAYTYIGTTTISGGTLAIANANVLPSATNVTLGGGTFNTGASAGFSQTVSTLTLTDNSTIALGTGSHTLTFAASNGVTWTSGKTLTITGWTGSAGNSGTAGKIFVGSTASGLTTTQLSQIIFSGYPGGAIQLSTGEVVPGVPSITPSPTSLSGFTYAQGSGPSASQSFTISASNLTPGGGTITITGSTDYEVSNNNSTFGSSTTLAYTGTGTLASNTIYIRLKAGLSAGNYNSETINISGGGATSSITVSGSVTPPSTITPSPTALSGFTYVQSSGPSASQSFTIAASNLTSGGGTITINGSTDYEVSNNNSSFGSSTTLTYTGTGTLASNTIYVRLKSGLSAANYNSETISISGGGASSSVTVSGSVSAAPSITPSPTLLTGFTYMQGSGPSASQSFTIAASNLTSGGGTVTITGSTDYEVSNNNASFGSSTTLTYTGTGTLASNTIYLRLKAGLSAGNYNLEAISISGGGATSSVTVSGNVTGASTITPSPTSLSGFTYVQGSGPSASQSFTIAASNLTAGGGTITITGSTDYEVSNDNSIFGSSTTLTYTGIGTLASNTVFVRLKAGLSAGNYNTETITISGGGAFSSIIVSGNVTPPPTITPSPTYLSGFTYVQGFGPSSSQSFTISASNLTAGGGIITVSGSTDYEVSNDNTTFGSSTTLTYTGTGTLASNTVYVRLKGGLSAGSYNTETISINGGSASSSVIVSGNVTPPPTITPSPTTLTDFTYIQGSGPSASQSFTITANNLTAGGGTITINGSAYYEVSNDNSTFGASTTLTYTGTGTLASSIVYVRLKSGLTAASYNSETIAISGGGATSSITASGSVTPPPAITPSPATLTGFTYVQGSGPSASQSFTITASNLTSGGGTITITGSTDYEVSNDNSTFGVSTTLTYTGTGTLASNTVYVRLKVGLSTGTYNGETISISGGGATSSVTVSGNITVLPYYYWNGPFITGNGPSTGGTGTWNTTTTNWIHGSDDVSGKSIAWASSATNYAFFNGTAGTLTIPASETFAQASFNTSGYTLTTSGSSTIALTGPIVLANNVNLNLAPINAAALTVSSITGGTNSGLTIAGGSAAAGNAIRLNLASGGSIASTVPVTITTTGTSGISGIVSSAGTATVNATITNNSGVTTMLGVTSSDILNINGVVSGSAAVQFSAGSSGGAGTVNLNAAGTWSGNTNFNGTASGFVKLGITNGISTVSNVVMGFSSGSGQVLDLNGFDQTIASLTSVYKGTGGITDKASGSGTNTLTINGAFASDSLDLVISDGTTRKIALVRTGTGTTTLAAANTYTGGTTISGGSLVLGVSGALAASASGALALDGGTLSTGTTTGHSDTLGPLTLTNNSVIALGTGSHKLIFGASNGVAWTSGSTLTINGWQGNYDGTSGTAGKIFVGTSASGLTTAQLVQIQFYDGTSYYAATILGTGEVVPTRPMLVITGTTDNGSSCIGTAASPITYTITNTGSVASGITVSSDNTEFAVSGLSSTTIVQNGTATFQVIFTPSASGSQTANITVSSTTAHSNSPTIALTGNGNTPPSATISYSGSPYCSSGGTATVTMSGTTGGTYSSTTGLVIDGTSGDVNLSSSTAGTYTVTYTVAAAGGCAVYTTTTSITIAAAASATINYYGSPYCPGTGTASVTQTGTTGGTYTSTTGLSINSTTGAVDLSLSTSGTYTVTYSVSPATGCSGVYTTTALLTIGVDTWTGVTSTDWNDGTNWSCGHVPSINSDAVIPAGGGYYPSVSTAGPAATVHNLTINSGASLTVTSQTLQVSDSINNSGTFDVSIGTLELNGRNLQFIPAGAFTGNKIRNLVISNNVSFNGTDSLTGNLSFGASLDTFSTNGNLTLRSTASRTGSVGIIANGNAISGNVTVERYIATGPGTLPSDHAKSWELLAVPTMGQTINQSWMEGATASNVALQGAGASNPKPGYGTMITSNVANAATFPTPGFDAYTAPGPTVKAYNYATNSYVGPATTGAAVYDQRGWFTFVRGDRSVYTASGAGSTADHTILRTTGTLITPAVSQPVSTVPAGYFQSVGNPFASPVDMTRISATGGMINQYIYVWDPRVGGSYNYGAFVTLQFDGTNYRVQTNGGYSYPANDTVYNYIQNGQAFFMYANAANGDGTVTFPETAKVPDTTFITPFTRQGDGGTVNSLPGTGARVTGTQTPSIRTSLNTVNADGSTGSVVDQVLNQYDDSYSNSVDGYDGRKAANTGENLSINTTGTLLVVEKRHTIVGNDTIFLNLTSERVQAYQFNINASSLSTVDSGFIIDNYLNTRRQLNLKGNTKINFNVVNVAGSYAANRFELVFVALKVLPSTIASVRAYQQSRGSTNINVDWSVSNEHGIQKYVVERSADSVTFTRLTVSKPTANDGSDVSYSVTDSKPLSGTNYYRIKMVDTLGNITYSVIVSVNIGAVKNNIEIYPNPVTDGKIHLQFSNEKAGKYGIRLLDKSGQVISEKQITRQEGNSTELLEWNYSIAHGIYQVEITRPDGSTKNINVLY